MQAIAIAHLAAAADQRYVPQALVARHGQVDQGLLAGDQLDEVRRLQCLSLVQGLASVDVYEAGLHGVAGKNRGVEVQCQQLQ